MKKYRVGISELGYEEVVEAEDEQEAEEMALIHCKKLKINLIIKRKMFHYLI